MRPSESIKHAFQTASNPPRRIGYNAAFCRPDHAMTKRRAFLLLTLSFTLFFIALIGAGGWLLAQHSRQFAVACFLFAFAAAFGQITSLALFIREHARAQAAQRPSENTVPTQENRDRHA